MLLFISPTAFSAGTSEDEGEMGMEGKESEGIYNEGKFAHVGEKGLVEIRGPQNSLFSLHTNSTTSLSSLLTPA